MFYNNNEQKRIAIILAGGVGSRVGASCPKQFINIFGKPILGYTIEKFEHSKHVDLILIVCIKEYRTMLEDLIISEGYKKIVKVVDGGKTFQDSVINGIEGLRTIASEDDIILIHYGASPFVDDEIISDAIRICREKGNASPARSLIYLSAHSDQSDSSSKYLNRDEVVCFNSPQVLTFNYLSNLYKMAEEKGILYKVDPHTTSLMLSLGERIYYSMDKTSNIKITTPEDVELFKAWTLKDIMKSRQIENVSNL